MTEETRNGMSLAEIARLLREQFQDIMDAPVPAEIEDLLKQLEEKARADENES